MANQRRADSKIAQIVAEFREGSLNLGQANNLISGELNCSSDVTFCFLRAMRRSNVNTVSMNRGSIKWPN